MALIFITGVPGSGKSAVERLLRKMGYESYDADSIGAAYNIQSGAVVKVPPAEERTPEWFQAHQWRVQRERVEQLEQASRAKPIFICGTASNEEELWDLFDQVFILRIDEQTLRQRLHSRVDNDYGKNEHELQEILDKHKASARKFSLPKVTAVDATQPLEAVVSEILGGISE